MKKTKRLRSMSFVKFLSTTFFSTQKLYNKQYDSLAEEKQRFSIFVNNEKKIFKHNQLYSLDEVTFKLKSNEYADLTHGEFLSKYVNDRTTYDKRCVLAIDFALDLHEFRNASFEP